MQTVVIILLAVLCAILLIDMISLERGLRRGKKQIREQMEGSSTVRLNTPCPNAAAEELFETVWGEEYLDCNNTVMVHIRRLREKLGERPRNPKYIKTVWGVGYKIEK